MRPQHLNFFCLQCAVFCLVAVCSCSFSSVQLVFLSGVTCLAMKAVNLILLTEFILFEALSLLGHRSLEMSNINNSFIQIEKIKSGNLLQF